MDREVSKMEGGRDLEGLGNRTILHTCKILHCKSPMYRIYILIESLDKCNATSKSIIVIYCYNYNNQYRSDTWEIYHL